MALHPRAERRRELAHAYREPAAFDELDVEEIFIEPYVDVVVGTRVEPSIRARLCV
jgi:hypothetical protein